MSTGKPHQRGASRWQVGTALAVMVLAPATAMAQSPAAQTPATAQPLPPMAQPPPPMPPAAPAPYVAPAQAPYVAPAPPAALAVAPDATATSAGATGPSDATSAVPMTVIDRALLETTGTASLGQALQQLSFQSNALNTQFNNGGDGSTRIALRGLGATRTLVLLNGRRHVHGGTGADATVDLESIPLALVERVEIVRGASGIHGLGGAAGVVNIVTRQDLDGVEASLFAGGTPESQGQTYDASVAVGKRFDGGRITAAAGYHEQQAILSGDREFSRSDTLFDWTTGEVTNLGSSATPEGTIVDYGEGEGNAAWQAVLAQNPGASIFFNDPAVGWRAFQTTGTSDTGEGDYYNYQPENYLVTPLARYHAFAAGDYQLGDRLRAFAEAGYVNRRSEQQLASEPLFTATEGVVVATDNLYNPFGRDFFDVRRRVVEAGNRRSEQEVETMRLVLGLDGELPLGSAGTWRWQASYGYGATDSTQTHHGNLRRDRLAGAVGPSFIDAQGRPRCGTPDSPIDGCVPLDLFGGIGSITPEMLSYLGYSGVDQGHNEQHRFAVEAGGDLMRTSSGAGVAVAVGADYRDESGFVHVDPVDTTGTSRTSLEGGYDVRGVHGSLTVIPFMDQLTGRALEIQAATSAFDLSTSGAGASWHVAGVARLGAGLAVRASQGRNMGAPSLSALFSETSEAFPAAVDPCDTSFGPRSPNAEANCLADGLPDDFVDGRQQIRTLQGGNAELRPETSDIRSAGVVFAPDAAAGLVLSADYFEIALSDEVNTLGAAHILQSCYDSAPGARSNCERIVRDASTGAIDSIVDTLANRGTRETSGVDVQLGYDSHSTIGRMQYRAGGTWLKKLEIAGADGVAHVGQGVYDLGVYPEYRLDGSLLWDNGVFGAGASVRYVGSFTECELNDCAIGREQDVAPLSREVESYFTGDLLGSFTLASSLGRTVLAVGVRNVMDRQPPIIHNGFTANSDASAYDFTGRFAYLRLTQQF
jgi:iron complex outermembrane receptor protein